MTEDWNHPVMDATLQKARKMGFNDLMDVYTRGTRAEKKVISDTYHDALNTSQKLETQGETHV